MFGLDYNMTKFQLGSTMLTVQPNLLFGLFCNLTTTEFKVTAFLVYPMITTSLTSNNRAAAEATPTIC